MKCYTVKQAAEILNVNPQTIKREIERNKLHCFRVGNEIRLAQQHLDEYANVGGYGKTAREIELEEEIERLKKALSEKDNTINNIKTEILRAS